MTKYPELLDALNSWLKELEKEQEILKLFD